MKQISKALFLLFFLLLACQKPIPQEPQNPLLNEDTMATFLTELHFHECMVSNRYISSENSAFFYQKLFEKYQVTAEDFDNAMMWYEGNYKTYMSMYAKVRANFEKEIKKIKSGIYNDYLPQLPSIWTYYGVVPSCDTTWHTLRDLSVYLELPAPELRTDHCSSHPYVERLRSTTPYWKVRN